MKRLIVLLLLAASSLIVTAPLAHAQAATVQPTVRTSTGGYHPLTVMPRHNYGTVVAISGDSIVAEGNLDVSDRLITKLTAAEHGLLVTMVDKTVGGQLLAGPAPSLSGTWASLLASHPHISVVYTEVGTDDLYGTSDSEWFADYTSLDQQARAAGIRLVPMLLTPLNDSIQRHDLREPQRYRFNNWLVAHFGAGGVVDTPSVLAGSNGQLLAAYDFGDGMHLNPAGVSVLSQAVLAHMRSIGVPTP